MARTIPKTKLKIPDFPIPQEPKIQGKKKKPSRVIPKGQDKFKGVVKIPDNLKKRSRAGKLTDLKIQVPEEILNDEIKKSMVIGPRLEISPKDELSEIIGLKTPRQRLKDSLEPQWQGPKKRPSPNKG